MSPTLNVLHLMLPPAPMGRRVLATFCDLTLVFFLSLFVIGKLWIPIYHAEGLVQFRMLWNAYASQLEAGQFLEFFNQLNSNKNMIDMFMSIDRMLFIITWAYYAINSFIFQGGSLGKQIFNLRVLKMTTFKPLNGLDGFFRSGILTFFLFTAWPFFMCFNLCFMGINALHRGMHDWLCQTYVVSYHVLEQIKDRINNAVQSTTNMPKSSS